METLYSNEKRPPPSFAHTDFFFGIFGFLSLTRLRLNHHLLHHLLLGYLVPGITLLLLKRLPARRQLLDNQLRRQLGLGLQRLRQLLFDGRPLLSREQQVASGPALGLLGLVARALGRLGRLDSLGCLGLGRWPTLLDQLDTSGLGQKPVRFLRVEAVPLSQRHHTGGLGLVRNLLDGAVELARHRDGRHWSRFEWLFWVITTQATNRKKFSIFFIRYQL